MCAASGGSRALASQQRVEVVFRVTVGGRRAEGKSGTMFSREVCTSGASESSRQGVRVLARRRARALPVQRKVDGFVPVAKKRLELVQVAIRSIDCHFDVTLRR